MVKRGMNTFASQYKWLGHLAEGYMLYSQVICVIHTKISVTMVLIKSQFKYTVQVVEVVSNDMCLCESEIHC